ncbi:hypothetical protein Rs2_45711 [Raphanus sativus]|nr:hypothetical protein Rs2_45711 [Raphanus sativus]
MAQKKKFAVEDASRNRRVGTRVKQKTRPCTLWKPSETRLHTSLAPPRRPHQSFPTTTGESLHRFTRKPKTAGTRIRLTQFLSSPSLVVNGSFVGQSLDLIRATEVHNFIPNASSPEKPQNPTGSHEKRNQVTSGPPSEHRESSTKAPSMLKSNDAEVKKPTVPKKPTAHRDKVRRRKH